MSKNKLTYIGGALLVIVVLVFGYLGIKLPDVPIPAPAEIRGTTNFDDLKIRNLTATGTASIAGTLGLNGAVTIGDGGDTVAVNSSDWDISTTGAMTGIGALTSDGAWFTSSTIGATGAISNTGLLSVGGGAGDSGCTISAAGAIVCNSSADIDGAATITGTTTLNGTATIGDGGDTVAVNSSDWDISTTGAMTGIGAITSDGAWFTSSTIGATGAISNTGLLSVGGGAGDSGCTISAAGAIVCNSTADIDGAATITGTTTLNGAVTIGDGGDTVAVNSSDWDINATGDATGLGAITSDGLATVGSFFTGGNANIAGNVVVTGTSTLIGGATTTAAMTMNGGATVAGGDLTLSPITDGGNKGIANQFIGLPRITMAGLGQMADGTSETVLTDIGDSETPATDWTKVSAGTSVTSTNTTDYFKQGSASLKVEFGTDAVAGEGVTNALASGDQNWTDDEAFGFWLYTTKALDAGDLTLRIADATAGGGYTSVNVPAATADSWQWLEVNVTLGNNNLKDVITDLSVVLSAAGQAKAAAGAFICYFDFFVKWDVADEKALPQSILQDGVLSLMSVTVTDAGAASANPVEYTNYFVHYQSGADAIVPITDLADTGIAYVALLAY